MRGLSHPEIHLKLVKANKDILTVKKIAKKYNYR